MGRDPARIRLAAIVLLALFLLAAGVSASSKASMTITGRVLPQNPITVDFEGNPLSGCAPLKVRFTDLSTSSPPAGMIRFREWTFYPEGSMTSVGRIAGPGNSQRNPSFTFRCPGLYDVSLKVCDRTDCSGYNNTLKKSGYICAGGPDYAAEIDAMRSLVVASGLDRLPRRCIFDPSDLLRQLDSAKAELGKPGCSNAKVVQHLTRFSIDLRLIQWFYRLNPDQKAAVKELMDEAERTIDGLSSCSTCPMLPVACGSLTC